MNKEQKEQMMQATKKAYVSASVKTAEKIIVKAAENVLRSKGKK